MRLVVNGAPHQVDVEADMPPVGSEGCAGPDRHEIWMRCLHLRGLAKGLDTGPTRAKVETRSPALDDKRRGRNTGEEPPMRLVVNGTPHQVDVEADMPLVGSHGCAGPDRHEIWMRCLRLRGLEKG